VAGLVLSVALMGISAEFFSRIIQRYKWLGYIGVAILLYVSTDLIFEGLGGLGWIYGVAEA
ncbi:MAG: TerC family protein, partial [Pseudomonadota bacterium]